MRKLQSCVQKTVEVIRLVPQERIQERIAEQFVDIPLPQIMEEMLSSSTYASESYGRTDLGRLHSPDSGGNFRVGVIRHAFHLAQILRAHATRYQSLKVVFTARTQGACSQRHCGESPRVKLQRLSSEDCRTPVRGQAVNQSAEMRSALEFCATAQSCRERSLEISFSGFPGFLDFSSSEKFKTSPLVSAQSELSAHQMGVLRVFGGPPFYLAGAKDQSVSSSNGRSPFALEPPSSSISLLHPRCRKSFLKGRRVRLRYQRHRS